MKNDELAVLGKAMMDSAVLDMMLSECTDEHFSLEPTRFIFHLIQECFDKGIKPAPSEIKKMKPEAESWIQDCIIQGSKTINIEANFNEMIKTKNRNSLLKMIEALIVITTDPIFEPEEAEEMINLYLPEKHSMTSLTAMVEIAAAIEEAEKQLDEKMKNKGKMPGVALSYRGSNGAMQGFPSLDEVLYGLRPGDFIMFAAKSGHGKTTLAMNLSRIISYHNKQKLYYLNTEMDITQMVNRWSSMATMIPYSDIERGEITESDREEVRKWNDKFSGAPLLVSQLSELTMEGITALTKSATRKYGKFDCIIVDYIGRMDVKETKGMQEYQIMSYLAKKLKTFAQQQQLPVIVLAQLNDEGKLEGAKKMRNECDGLFYMVPKTEESEVDGKKVSMYSQSEYYMLKEKVRRGSTNGVIKLDFAKKYMFIREM